MNDHISNLLEISSRFDSCFSSESTAKILSLTQIYEEYINALESSCDLPNSVLIRFTLISYEMRDNLETLKNTSLNRKVIRKAHHQRQKQYRKEAKKAQILADAEMSQALEQLKASLMKNHAEDIDGDEL